jgi:hypothetical protein
MRSSDGFRLCENLGREWSFKWGPAILRTLNHMRVLVEVGCVAYACNSVLSDMRNFVLIIEKRTGMGVIV